MTTQIVIRPVTTLAEMEEVQRLESAVWKMDKPVPTHQMLVAVQNGGILLAAYEGATMVGMLYGFPGFLGGEAYLYSYMMGIREGWRGRGIGEKLKLRQAAMAKTLGYRLIVWTYDPLEAVNGRLNIGKLGAICSTYIENCYGEMNDQLNRGLPSDRFQVEWRPDRKLPPLPEGEAHELIRCHTNGDGLPVPEAEDLPTRAGELLAIAVPANFQDIKRRDSELAKAWRQVTRDVFRRVFRAGWAVAGFQSDAGPGVHRYLLRQRTELPVPLPPWNGS
ncbi:MAG: GNAT family N-acetyltransferase [Negativicutes bacterium]|nr:GNAT family N-acetyltransferase [Negativicutes bacterium]